MARIFFMLFLLSCSFLYGVYSTDKGLTPYTELVDIYDFYKSYRKGVSNDENVINVKGEIEISGLPAFSEEGSYYRLPKKVRDYTREDLRDLSEMSSGGKASFMTTAKELEISAILNGYRTAPYMTSVMQFGFDVYVDGKYSGSVSTKDNNKISRQKVNLGKDQHLKKIDIYFPLYGKVEKFDVFISDKEKVVKTSKMKDKIVFYGSSITQGCCVSNPGLSYPTVVSESIDMQLINLGFSGNGLGDLDIADYISSINPKILVLDYWANPSSEQYKESLPEFYNHVRKNNEDMTILLLAPFVTPHRDIVQKAKYNSSINFVKLMNAQGDNKIYFVDGLINKNESIAFVDARHLNSYGNVLVADRLLSFIQEVRKH